MGLFSILFLDAIALVAAYFLRRRYPQGAYEDVALLVLIGALMLAMTPRIPGLVLSAVGWGVLAAKTMRFGTVITPSGR